MIKSLAIIAMVFSMVFTGASMAQKPKLTDPEVASVAVTANQ